VKLFLHAVLVNQASESVPSVDLTGLFWNRKPQEWCRPWRDEAKASMRSMAVVLSADIASFFIYVQIDELWSVSVRGWLRPADGRA
jgi:hypothetical protein